MKFKKLLYLILVLIAIIGLSFFKKIQSDRQEKEEQKEVTRLESVVEGLDASVVRRIVVAQGQDKTSQVILAKNDAGDWFIESLYNARANKYQIEQILKAVSEIKGTMRADSKEVLEDFSMTDEKGVHMEFFGFSNAELLRLVCAPERAPSGGNFVRKASSNKIYLTEANLLGSFNLYNKTQKLDAKSFVDFQVVKLDVGKVTRLEVLDKSTLTTLVKSEDKEKKTSEWKLEPSGKDSIDQAKVSAFLSSLTSLSISQVLDPSQTDYRFDEKSPWVRVFHSKDDKPVQTELYLGKPVGTKKDFGLKMLPEGLIFEINEAVVQGIKTDRASFIAPANPSGAKPEASKK